MKGKEKYKVQESLTGYPVLCRYEFKLVDLLEQGIPFFEEF